MESKRVNHRLKTKRSNLCDVLPLATPFVIHVDVSSACNFKCRFCFHGLPEDELKRTGFVPRIMEFDLFKLTIDKIREFPDKLKRLCLIRHGEALLNPRLPEMIAYAKAAGIAEQINISTNGSLLTRELADALIKSGLDEVLISVEAVSDEDYKKISNIDINFEEYVNNLRYFYENRGNCKIHVKTVDVAMDTPKKLKRFHEIFDDISDSASIEYIQPFFHEVDYGAFMDTEFSRNLIGMEYKDIKVCSQPFFQMHIAPDGTIQACNPDYNNKIVMGNVKANSLPDVWTGVKWNELRAMHLRGERHKHKYCAFCKGGACYTFETDNLDPFMDKLLERY